MQKKSYRLIIDGINLDASHFASKTEEDAIKAMEKDKIEVPGENDQEKATWRKNAYAQMKEHVEKQSRKAASKGDVELKTQTKEMQEAQRAAGVGKPVDSK